MSDNKKYYYLKLKENFFESEEIKLLEAGENGYLYSNILLKMYLKSLKTEGRLMFRENIPYNSKMLSVITGHNLDIIDKAINIFIQFGLVQVLDNGAIYLIDIQNYIGESSTEADRVREYRSKIANENKVLSDNSTNGVQMYDKCTPEIELEIEKELEKEEIHGHQEQVLGKNKSQDLTPYAEILKLFEESLGDWLPVPKFIKPGSARQKHIKARWQYELPDLPSWGKFFLKIARSDFLCGRSKLKDGSFFRCTFDWIINESNCCKILDNNYSNKE